MSRDAPQGPGFVDTHCHVLPGIDDGAQTMEESLEFCRIALRDGVAVTVATPHVRQDRWENTVEGIRSAVGELRDALKREEIDHRVEFGAEVHLRPDLPQLVEAGEIPTMADGGKYLLLEFPRVFPDYLGEEVVEGLRGRGVIPIIAHPERIDTLVNRPELMYRLVRSGAIGQLTAGSLAGTFGGAARKAARLFLRSNLIHLLGSDAHSTRRRRPELSRAMRNAAAVVGEREARRLVVDNAHAVLEGREFEIEQPREPGGSGGFFARLLGG